MDDREGRIGWWISGGAHAALILWAILGGVFFRPQPSTPLRATEVSTMSGAEFEALAAASRGAGPVGADATAMASLPEPAEEPDAGEAPAEASAPDAEAAAQELAQPGDAEARPDLSDFAPQPPVAVTTDLPETGGNQTDLAEAAPDRPTATDTPQTGGQAGAQPLRPTSPDADAPAQPVAPRSELALDRSAAPRPRPEGLVESHEAAIAAREAAADGARQAAARAEQERLETQRQAAEEAARQAATEAEAARQAEAAAEARQRAAERREAEERRQAAERAEREQQEAEAARQRAEEEHRQAEAARQERERQERERQERERQAAEARAEEERRAEAERWAAEERRAAEAARQAEEQAEAERRAAAERQEAERREAEQRAAVEREAEERRAAVEREVAERAAAEREAAERRALEDALREAEDGAAGAEGTDTASTGDAAGGSRHQIEGGAGASAAQDPLAAALAGALSGAAGGGDQGQPAAEPMQLAPSSIRPMPPYDPAGDQGADAGIPMGPPLSMAEREGLRFAISECWNKGALSVEASHMTVSVGFTMTPDGHPDQNSFRLAGWRGGSETAARHGFEVARRAIILCGRAGYPLPREKYGRWREVVVDFRPDGITFD